MRPLSRLFLASLLLAALHDARADSSEEYLPEEEMKMIDTDQDGKASFEEILAVVAPEEEEQSSMKHDDGSMEKVLETFKRRAREHFGKSDKDGDEKLDIGELGALMHLLEHDEELNAQEL